MSASIVGIVTYLNIGARPWLTYGLGNGVLTQSQVIASFPITQWSRLAG